MQRLTVVLALMMSASAAVAAELTATRLDGSTVVGSLHSWDDQVMVVTSKDGVVRLSASELLSFRWSPKNGEGIGGEPRTLQPTVELVDGTEIPVDDFGRRGNAATLSLRGPLPPELKSLETADKSVATARLRPLESPAAAQWREIRNQKFVSDVLVLIKRNGQSLDYVEGTLGDVTSDRIEFKLEDEVRRVERDKVAGLIFYRSANPVSSEPKCIVRGSGGLRALVSSASLEDGLVKLKTLAGPELHWPIDDIQVADFSAGKVVFLSDLEPASVEVTPLVGLPAGATLSTAYGQPRRDHSAFGGPLSLWLAGDDPTAPGSTQTYSRGLAVRSRSALVYRVPRGFTRLLGVAGIEPATRHQGSARLTITADERTLLDTELRGDQAAENLELNVTGSKRLKIVVDYGENLDIGDWVNLCDIRMVR